MSLKTEMMFMLNAILYQMDMLGAVIFTVKNTHQRVLVPHTKQKFFHPRGKRCEVLSW